jgi:hypothetical protein
MAPHRQPAGLSQLNVNHRIVDAAVAQLEAFRRGAGGDVELHLDTNFNYESTATVSSREQAARSGCLESISTTRPGWPIRARPHAGFVLQIIVRRRQFRPYFEPISRCAIIDVAGTASSDR